MWILRLLKYLNLFGPPGLNKWMTHCFCPYNPLVKEAVRGGVSYLFKLTFSDWGKVLFGGGVRGGLDSEKQLFGSQLPRIWKSFKTQLL